MTHTSTSIVRNLAILAVFFIIQFFWFTATYTYSESRLDSRSQERQERVPAVSQIASVPDVPKSSKSAVSPPAALNDSPFDILKATTDLAGPGKSAADFDAFGNDLGAKIKYCIVFPLLEGAGPPLPTFNVPVCEGGPTPPQKAELKVVKIVINDDDGTATTSDFALFVDSTRISSGATIQLSAGTYTVSEATTTVAVGTSTMTYVQDFSGDCDASGSVVLSAGESKTCTVTNDDPGLGGQGGNPDDGDGGGSNNPNDGDGNGGGRGGRGGRILGASTPDFMGGGDGAPGVPNTGGGGKADGTLGLLVFSFAPTVLGLAYLSTSFRKPRFDI